jgi:hypothetical protein
MQPLSIIRIRSRVVIGAMTLLLFAGPAGAGSQETLCENAKLRAADSYTSCLIRAVTKAKVQGQDPSEDAISRCDEGFDRAFGQAEAGGACRTPGGASTLRVPIKAHVFQTTAAGHGKRSAGR